MVTFRDMSWSSRFSSPPSQISRKIWLGKWNSKRDREPDKSDEAAFKGYLVSKYERRSWYVDPKEAVKEEERSTPKPEPKLAPPPSVKVCSYTCNSFMLLE